MKKKSPRNVDATEVLVQIQEQLAALDQKLEAFINKSLTDIAGALAAQKLAATPRPVQASSLASIRLPEQNRRPKFAIVCFQCGKDSELPFKPTPGRPVYCPECFAMRKAGHVPKVNNEVKPLVEVKAPEVKAKKKAPVAKKSVVKKPVAKKAVIKKPLRLFFKKNKKSRKIKKTAMFSKSNSKSSIKILAGKTK